MPEIERRRKKPLVFDVLLWDGGNYGQVRDFALGDPGKGSNTMLQAGRLAVWNEQEEAWFAVPVGHYVVKGTLGELYPLSPSASEATYEPAVDGGGKQETEWCVFYGGSGPYDCAGFELYDEEDAEEALQWFVEAGIAKRTVSYGPWVVTTPPDDPEAREEAEFLADAASLDGDFRAER